MDWYNIWSLGTCDDCSCFSLAAFSAMLLGIAPRVLRMLDKHSHWAAPHIRICLFLLRQGLPSLISQSSCLLRLQACAITLFPSCLLLLCIIFRRFIIWCYRYQYFILLYCQLIPSYVDVQHLFTQLIDISVVSGFDYYEQCLCVYMQILWRFMLSTILDKYQGVLGLLSCPLTLCLTLWEPNTNCFIRCFYHMSS